jgi:uncharacterized protein (DUF433 family)
MSLAIQNDAPPLRQDANGKIRVGNSRVSLDVVVNDFQDGATPEEIAQGYPTLELGDIYAAVGYYLRHRSEVDEYIRAGEAEADELEKRIKSSQPDLTGIRERLLARRHK